jgi:hypothetical protein
MESPKKVAMETARALAQRPEVLVRAATVEVSPEWAEPAIQTLAVFIEEAMKRCTCRSFPREG